LDVSDVILNVLNVKLDVSDIILRRNPIESKNEPRKVEIIERKGRLGKILLELGNFGWMVFETNLKFKLSLGGGSATTCNVLNSGGSGHAI
jgi:hypothetical protein